MIVEFMYTNYRGERARRSVVPIRVTFDTNAWKDADVFQWNLEAVDPSRGGQQRQFACKDIEQLNVRQLSTPNEDQSLLKVLRQFCP